MCLEKMHLCEGCMHLMAYQWRPRQMAEVRSLQSQLHCVNGRSASGDRIIVIDVRGLGDKDRPTFSEMFRNGFSPTDTFYLIKRNWEPSHPSTRKDVIRNSIGARCRIFLQSNEFIKFGTINGPTKIVSSFLNIPQAIFVLVMPRDQMRAWKMDLQHSHSLLPDSSSFYKQGMT